MRDIKGAVSFLQAAGKEGGSASESESEVYHWPHDSYGMTLIFVNKLRTQFISRG